jgi:hypothetical protein
MKDWKKQFEKLEEENELVDEYDIMGEWKKEILEKFDKDTRFYLDIKTYRIVKKILEKSIDDVHRKKEEINNFIKDIAKLLGDDNLGHDGISWSIEDFEDRIKEIKDDVRKEKQKSFIEGMETAIEWIRKDMNGGALRQFDIHTWKILEYIKEAKKANNIKTGGKDDREKR